MIAFTVHLDPHGKLAPKPVFVPGLGRAKNVTPTKSREYMQNFAAQAVRHAPTVPFLGPLRVRLTFTFAPPADGWKRAAALAGALLRTQKPDVDNLQKAALDAITKTGAFWRDDSQVNEIHVQRCYGERPGILVEIEPLPQVESAAAWKDWLNTKRAVRSAAICGGPS